MRFQTQISSKQLLLAAAILSFAIALFQAVLSFSPPLSSFFGAAELAANPLLLCQPIELLPCASRPEHTHVWAWRPVGCSTAYGLPA